MKTQLLHHIEPAADILRSGGLVAFPTETVFGLGADAGNAEAVARLFQAKGRPSDNPLIVHVADAGQWPLAARHMTPLGQRVLDLFAPGPVTVVLPKSQRLCDAVTAGLDSVGLRIPAANLTRQLLRLAGIPVAAPSANRSGRPSGTTWASVLEDLDGRVDAILCLEVPHVGLESSVIDCLGEDPVLLRPGAVGLDELRAHFPRASQLGADCPAEGASRQAAVKSPGLHHPHYQPRARVVLWDRVADPQWRAGDAARNMPQMRCAYAGVAPAPQGMVLSECYADWELFAQAFYEFLRRADRAQVEMVVIEAVPAAMENSSGLAAALRDRQQRAAGVG